MKKLILDRIKALGGNIDQVKGESFIEDLLSITFNTVLYERPQDAPWADAEEQEPIYGLANYINQHQVQFKQSPDAF